MKQLSGYLTNFTAPSAGFSEGQFKDDPGDGTGSGILAQMANDLYYAIVAGAEKYIGGITDTDESESASDALDFIETAIGIKNENVSEYDNTTTYAQDAHVMYLGEQYVSMINSNTGNNPLDNPDKWFPCYSRTEILQLWRKGDDISGGFDPLHDYRDGTNYRFTFQCGKYNFGGDSSTGAGRNFQATGVHLDGTQITGNPTLVALFDVGGGSEYHLLDIIAPDVAGTRTLMDARGRVGRDVDNSADTENVGVVQEDAMQRITGSFSDSDSVGIGSVRATSTPTGVFTKGTSRSSHYTSVSVAANDLDFDSSNSTSPNTAKTDDDETRMKNYTKGLSWIVVMQEI